MIALAIFAVAVVMIATAATIRRHADRVIAEVLAVEQRQIAREHSRGIEAGFAAGWHGGGRR